MYYELYENMAAAMAAIRDWVDGQGYGRLMLEENIPLTPDWLSPFTLRTTANVPNAMIGVCAELRYERRDRDDICVGYSSAHHWVCWPAVAV